MLNPRQQVFADAIVSGSTGKAAAIAAGYSERSAEVTASKLLRNPKVKTFIEAAQAKAAKDAGLNATGVLVAMKEGLDFDPAECFSEAGALLSVREMPIAIRRNLRGFKVMRIPGREDDAVIVEVKWTPRSEWTAQAAKVLNMNSERVEVSGVSIVINGVKK